MVEYEIFGDFSAHAYSIYHSLALFIIILFSCVYKLLFNHLMTLVLTKQWQMKRNVFVDFHCFRHRFSFSVSLIAHSQVSKLSFTAKKSSSHFSNFFILFRSHFAFRLRSSHVYEFNCLFQRDCFYFVKMENGFSMQNQSQNESATKSQAKKAEENESSETMHIVWCV